MQSSGARVVGRARVGRVYRGRDRVRLPPRSMVVITVDTTVVNLALPLNR
jgi:hypothetical protein